MTLDSHDCDDGWLDRDAGRFCHHCKPWLLRRRPPTREEANAARQRRQSATNPPSGQQHLPSTAQRPSAP